MFYDAQLYISYFCDFRCHPRLKYLRMLQLPFPLLVPAYRITEHLYSRKLRAHPDKYGVV